MSKEAVKAARLSILELLNPLLRKAEGQGLVFFSPDQRRYFTPAQLRAEQAKGRFIWGPRHWQLRNPKYQPVSLSA